ncbi:hypothetical protein [Desmospora activa]|uniref:Uncharacterized protein n=1 Tax=Desmospora activa DSM 45169 TaxID=1121389 RepID=A0A2T4Z0M8_9BACL|nr:hypothetical protein [Desmospora activa]PTM53260.1 hypothetical protein C8J48_3584 [Desmospora activa DSM 45169]
MGKEQEITYLLFDLIVGYLEQIPEEQRMIQRIEVSEGGLDLTLRESGHYRLEVKALQNDEIEVEENGEDEPVRNSYLEEEDDRVEIPQEDWNALVQACESLLELMEYDQRKMNELRQTVPQFPWDERKRMMEGMMDELRSALKRTLAHTDDDAS